VGSSLLAAHGSAKVSIQEIKAARWLVYDAVYGAQLRRVASTVVSIVQKLSHHGAAVPRQGSKPKAMTVKLGMVRSMRAQP
jgi:hypothetical protein